jgi:hypothetical protein
MADRTQLKQNVASQMVDLAGQFIDLVTEMKQLNRLYAEQQLEPGQADGIEAVDLVGEIAHLDTVLIQAWSYTVTNLDMFLENGVPEQNTHFANMFKMRKSV